MRKSYNDQCPGCGASKITTIKDYEEAQFLDIRKFSWNINRCSRCKQRFVHFLYSDDFRVTWLESDEIFHRTCYVKYLDVKPSKFNQVTVIYLFNPILSDRGLVIDQCEEYISSISKKGKYILVDWETGEKKCTSKNIWSHFQDVVILPDSVYSGSIGQIFPSFLAERIILRESCSFSTARLISLYPTINMGFLFLNYRKQNKIETVWPKETINEMLVDWSKIPSKKDIEVGV